MSEPPALDHVQVAAPPGCEEQARRFFTGLLGLEEITKPEALVHRGELWFVLGAQQLHVGVEESFAPARKAHVAIRLDAPTLDRIAAALVEAGVEVEWDHTLPDRRRFFSTDPWGNRIELLASS